MASRNKIFNRLIFVIGLLLGILAWNSFNRQDADPLNQDSEPDATTTSSTQRTEPLVIPKSHTPAYYTPPQGNGASPFDEPYPESISDEWILTFNTQEEYEDYINKLHASGVEIIGTIPILRSVRVNIAEDWAREMVDDLSPPGARAGFNVVVSIPPLPPPTKNYDETAIFNDKALSWLGAPSDIETWGKGIIVAVIDSGILEHPTIEGDVISFVDFTDPDAPVDDNSYTHGTAVAALITGKVGFAKGLAPGASIIDIRVLSESGAGDHFTLANGIVYAVDNGAQVINLSLGSYQHSPTLFAAILYASSNDVSIVAASGNDGVDMIPYPAAYPQVIGVGAVDALGRHTHFSNTGQGIDIAAPGLGIISALREDNLTHFSGTSAAAPFVSATLARIRSENPILSAQEAAEILFNNANDAGLPGHDTALGHGILNIERIEQRNETGIYDGAIANILLDTESLESGTPRLFIAVQNRGTEDLSEGATLTLTARLASKTFQIGALAPNQVEAVIWEDPELLIELQKGVAIEATISIEGAADDREHNDYAQLYLRLPDVGEEE